MQNKKAQSQIIGTILLIALVLVATGIITAFAIPFIKEQLSKSDCFKVADKLEITNHPQYTCYDSINNRMLVQVHLKDTEDIEAFTIELAGANSETFTITNGRTPKVFTYEDSRDLQLPQQNQERTYKIVSDTKPQTIRIYPIIKDQKTCDPSSTITTIKECYIP